MEHSLIALALDACRPYKHSTQHHTQGLVIARVSLRLAAVTISDQFTDNAV